MKKIALAAFSAAAVLALSACGGDATTTEPAATDTAVVEEVPAPEATDTAVATDAAATDAAATDAATDAAATDAPTDAATK